MKKKNFVDEQISFVVKASEKGPDWLYGRYKDKLTASKMNTSSERKLSKKKNSVLDKT